MIFFYYANEKENKNDHESKETRNHDEIRKWVEARGGRPAAVKSTERGEGDNFSAMLRIDFDTSNDSLEEISWDEFFKVFDENDLTFLYQEQTADGGESRFFKFVREK